MTAPLLEVSGLKGLFAKPLDFTLAPGECVTVTGPSGCGKTRLLRAIADLDPVEARIRLAGADRQTIPADQWRRQVGYVPAETVWWGERVGDHFMVECPPDWLARLGFEPQVMDWEVARLSSGEKQRLGLLRALVLQPRVLLLDEPTANLDPANTEKLERLVLEYLERQAAGALWISHDAGQRQRVSRRRLALCR